MAAWLVFALLVAGQLGCEVTPEKIASWKSTERGPKKIRGVLRQSSVAPRLRAQALGALVELGMTSEAHDDLGDLEDAERRQTLHEAVPLLVALSRGPRPADPPTRVQREAKDALFTFRSEAASEDRAVIDDALVSWVTADLIGRMTAGGQGAEKILTTIGARAGPRLAQLVLAGGPALVPAAAIFGRLADAESRTRTSAALVASARERGLRALDDPSLQAIALVGGAPAISLLLEAAEHGPEAIRERALYALARSPLMVADPTVAEGALRVAGDRRAPGKVREAAFQLVEHAGAQVVDGLGRFIAGDPDPTVRWRSVEAALAAGGEHAVGAVLSALAPGRGYKPEDLDSYVIHDLVQLGPAALPGLRAALGGDASSWVARVVAVRALGRLGTPEDLAALEALGSDSTKLRGFPAGATLGSEARAAAKALRDKR